MNRPSESRGSQPSGLLLVLFVEAKRIKPFPFRNFLTGRKFAPAGAARSACLSAACGGYPCCYRNNHAASRHFPAAKPLKRSLSGTFHLLLKKQDKTRGVGAPPPTEKARCACYGASRFCKPRFSSHRWRYHTCQKNSFGNPEAVFLY